MHGKKVTYFMTSCVTFSNPKKLLEQEVVRITEKNYFNYVNLQI